MITMNAQIPHAFALEHRDREGRSWCAVCGLPKTNARAQRLHSIPAQRDWRDRAYPTARAYDGDERAA